jgi:trehalose-6-phosphatase
MEDWLLSDSAVSVKRVDGCPENVSTGSEVVRAYIGWVAVQLEEQASRFHGHVLKDKHAARQQHYELDGCASNEWALTERRLARRLYGCMSDFSPARTDV